MQRKSQGIRPLFVTFSAILGAGLAALLVCQAGCGGSGTTERDGPVRPHDGVVLRVACPADVPAAVVRRCGQTWAHREGARVEVVTYDAEAGPAESGADVWVVAPADMPRWAAAGKLRSVPAGFTAVDGPFRWTDLLPLYRDKLLTWNETVYALPLVGHTPVCFYRTDLLAQHRAGLGAGPPGTWDEFTAIAEFFKDGKGGEGPAGLPPLPETDADLDREFHTVAAAHVRRAVGEHGPQQSDAELFSFHYDLKNMSPRLDQEGFVKALTLLRRWQACRAPGSMRAPAEVFRDGKAALCLADTTWIGWFQHRDSPVRDRFAVCRVPGTAGNWVPYLGSGGWLGVVPETSAHPDAAFALLADLAGKDTSAQIVVEPEWGGGAFRRDHLELQGGWNAFGLDRNATADLLVLVDKTVRYPGLKNPVLQLRIPDQRAHQKVLAAKVRAAVTEGQDPQQALREAAGEWQKLDAARGAEAHRRDYYLSLSLRP